MRQIEKYRTEIEIAAPAWHELLYGCFRLPDSARRDKLEEYLLGVLAPSLPILPYDDQAAERHAAERARLSLLGKTPSFTDGQIAAITYVHDLILVTRNVSDYEHFEGLTVENWCI